MFGKNGKGCIAVFGNQDPVTFLAQEDLEKITHTLFIVNDENSSHDSRLVVVVRGADT